jgi:protein-disulfide isomerase
MVSRKKTVAKEEEKLINTEVLRARMANLPKINYGVVMVVLLVAASFLIGRLSAQVEYLKGGGAVAAAPTTAPAQQQQKAPEVTLDQVKALFDKNKNIVFGDKNKKLLFVEFSDPSCPYCHVAAGLNGSLNKQVGTQFTLVADGGSYVAPVPEMKKLVDSGKAGFVWMYANGHGNGELASKALYCANEKGKFWQVHDLLMTQGGYDLLNNVVKNDKAKAGELAQFVQSAMNANDLKNCLESGKYDDRIAGDMSVAQAMGFSGTPHFLVNTTPFVGAYSFKDMQTAVDAALK